MLLTFDILKLLFHLVSVLKSYTLADLYWSFSVLKTVNFEEIVIWIQI